MPDERAHIVIEHAVKADVLKSEVRMGATQMFAPIIAKSEQRAATAYGVFPCVGEWNRFSV